MLLVFSSRSRNPLKFVVEILLPARVEILLPRKVKVLLVGRLENLFPIRAKMLLPGSGDFVARESGSTSIYHYRPNMICPFRMKSFTWTSRMVCKILHQY